MISDQLACTYICMYIDNMYSKHAAKKAEGVEK